MSRAAPRKDADLPRRWTSFFFRGINKYGRKLVSSLTTTKSSFILYLDSLDILDHLSDEESGQLFKAIRFYQENGKLPDLSSTIKIALVPFIRYFEINHANWLERKEKILKRNQENGAKGGRPKKPRITQDNPVGFKITQNNPEKPKITQKNPNVTVNVNDNESIKEKINKKEKDILEVFNFWAQKMNSTAKLDRNRHSKIASALAQYSVDELKKAIHGCSLSEWHMGQNPKGNKYNSIEIICRNAEKTEAFIQLANHPPRASPVERTNINDVLKNNPSYEGEL
jgi:hypothetical protein